MLAKKRRSIYMDDHAFDLLKSITAKAGSFQGEVLKSCLEKVNSEIFLMTPSSRLSTNFQKEEREIVRRTLGLE